MRHHYIIRWDEMLRDTIRSPGEMTHIERHHYIIWWDEIRHFDRDHYIMIIRWNETCRETLKHQYVGWYMLRDIITLWDEIRHFDRDHYIIMWDKTCWGTSSGKMRHVKDNITSSHEMRHVARYHYVMWDDTCWETLHHQVIWDILGYVITSSGKMRHVKDNITSSHGMRHVARYHYVIMWDETCWES